MTTFEQVITAITLVIAVASVIYHATMRGPGWRFWTAMWGFLFGLIVVSWIVVSP